MNDDIMDEEEPEYESSGGAWNIQADTLKRKLNKFKKVNGSKGDYGRSSSIHSGCAR